MLKESKCFLFKNLQLELRYIPTCHSCLEDLFAIYNIQSWIEYTENAIELLVLIFFLSKLLSACEGLSIGFKKLKTRQFYVLTPENILH